MYNGIEIIAEVKTSSPFGWRSPLTWDELFELANEYGDIISVHTDPRWGGGFDLVTKARSLTKKPILAKGIHTSDDEVKRAVEAGADYVLVVGRIPKVFQERCILEPLTLAALKEIPTQFKVAWNSRDLDTGGLKAETFEQARGIWKGWLCQASNIRTVSDINEGADAVLVGTYLKEFIESMNT